MMGGGSNVLVSDLGIRGVVLRVRGGGVKLTSAGHARADAGLTINGLVRWTIQRGLGGIESWAGTPGTVGGAVYGNAHFQGRHIGDLVTSARVVDREGGVRSLSNEELAFAYDRSRLQTSGEVLLTADVTVRPADVGTLRQRARESLRYRKQTQPLAMPSAGCIFQNPDPARDELPSGMLASAGALIDRAGLKGRSAGGIRISSVHANFFVNEGRGTARGVAELIALCQGEVKRQFGVVLREEIVRLGEGI
jgi:UDP-N-acetylmuramate dehydrogenase